MKRHFIFLISALFLFTYCDKNKNPYDFQAGIQGDAWFFSNLIAPDTVNKSYAHEDIRMLDLDNDNKPEIHLVSLLDTTASDSLIRTLRIDLDTNYTEDVYVSLLANEAPPAPVPYANGTQIKLDNELFYRMLKTFYLNRYFKDLSTDADSTDGIWTGLGERSFVVKFNSEGQSFASWIQINVTDIDQYIFYNWATYKLE
jgi:hypothetical protein